MALQPSITEYFATRKRPAIDDAKRSSQPSKKVMILENADGDVSIRKLVDERVNVPKIPSARRKLIYPNRPVNVVSASEANVTKKKILRRVLFDQKKSSSPQPDIRKTFGVLNGKSSSTSSTLKAKETNETCTNEVEMKIAPEEEPVKSLEKSEVEKSSIETTEVKETSVEQTAEDNSKVEVDQPALENTVVESLAVEKSSVSETDTLVPNSKTSVPKSSVPVDSGKSSVTKSVPEVGESGTRNAKTRTDLNLEKLKSKIEKSSKLNELKASLAKLNNGYANLEKIQKEKKNFSAKAQLGKFDMITFETTIPSPSKKTPIKMGMSPGKLREAAFGSPAGRRRLDLDSAAPAAPFVSPRKLLDSAAPMPPPSTTPPPSSPLKSPLKSPAFQRYQALVSEGKSALTLPFKYRSLAEVFRAIETVVSMLEKRQETTTFTKLKSSVQELLRRNLFEKHLAQIRSVNNAFYTFQYEKVHAVGSSKLQPDRYELVVKPVLGGLGANMSPDVLLERRRQFYSSLLEKTKVYHEQFLATLDPPLFVPRESLTRWHPEFDVDSVPDIELAALPEPPCSSKVSTAKDVLEKARNLFTSNPRMERALQKVSEQQSTLAEPAATTATSNTGPAVAALTTALKGIPKSLLEKVRAKQAARALEAMTRSPSQAKEAIRLTRLPEIARIVRNTFISEKKCVLTRELVLKKLSNSYRESLSFQELDSHLNLLQEKSPEWLNFCTFRKTDYVRFVKDADMLKVMAKLDALANQNCY